MRGVLGVDVRKVLMDANPRLSRRLIWAAAVAAVIVFFCVEIPIIPLVWILVVMFLSAAVPALSNPACQCYAAGFVIVAAASWWIWRRPLVALGAGIVSLAVVGYGVPAVWNAQVAHQELSPRWAGPHPLGPARTVALQGAPHSLYGGDTCNDLCLLLLYSRQADAVWQLPGDQPPSPGQMAADPPPMQFQESRMQFRLGGLAACVGSEQMYRQHSGPAWLDPQRSRLVLELARRRRAAEECVIAERKPFAPDLTIRWRERWEDRIYAEQEEVWEHALELVVNGRVVAREARHRRIYYASPLGAEVVYGSGNILFGATPRGSKWLRTPNDPVPPMDVAGWIEKHTSIRLESAWKPGGAPAGNTLPAESTLSVRRRIDRRLNLPPGALLPDELVTEYFQAIESGGLTQSDLPRLWRLLRYQRVSDFSQWPHQRLAAEPRSTLLRGAIISWLSAADQSPQQLQQLEPVAFSLPPGAYAGPSTGWLKRLDEELAKPGMRRLGQRLRQRRQEVASPEFTKAVLRACWEELPPGETAGLEGAKDVELGWGSARRATAMEAAGYAR